MLPDGASPVPWSLHLAELDRRLADLAGWIDDERWIIEERTPMAKEPITPEERKEITEKTHKQSQDLFKSLQKHVDQAKEQGGKGGK
jgi:hypothetical protein